MISMVLTQIPKFIDWLLSLVPAFEIPLIKFPQSFVDIINACHYFLPMDTIIVLVGIGISFTLFRITLSLIKLLIEILPVF